MKIYFFYEYIFFLLCEVWDEVLAQKVPCPLLKVVLEAKNRPQKKKKFYFFLFFLFFFIFFYFFLFFLFFLNCFSIVFLIIFF